MDKLQHYIWNTKYRYAPTDGKGDADIVDTWARVARAVAAAEADAGRWAGRFLEVLESWRFIPGGRVLAGAGTSRRVTLFNCFAAGPIPDTLGGILDRLKEAALTMQQGGGIGCDFSALRPAGSQAAGSGVIASGPVSFMRIWDAMCATLMSTSARRGAMMATLRCDHPDVETFIDAKRGGGALHNFNLSVLVTDAFIRAVADDADWDLAFPAGARPVRTVRARELWRRIAAAAHASAEPGVLFIDRINEDNNLWYAETLSTTNPCGEIPLPAHGACDLGSINLTRFVEHPFTERATIDEEGIAACVPVAVRFLDDVIDVSGFPLAEQAEQARKTRRIGLGVTGLADALIMTGHAYGSDDGRALATRILTRIRDTAYETSIELAREKGTFPAFDAERHLESAFIRRLPAAVRDGIAKDGIRNSHLLAIAPTGTISLLAGNVSSGIEPVFAFDAERQVRSGDDTYAVPVRDYAYAAWLSQDYDEDVRLPEAFVTAEVLRPDDHLRMQASLQPLVDNAISKTINLPAEAAVDDVLAIYDRARELGIKGCTVYRSGSLTGQVLKSRDEARCCHVERNW